MISDEFDYGCNRTRATGAIALEFEKFLYSLCLHCSIYKYQPISYKLGQDIFVSKISDEFDYGCNQTRTTGVICPCVRKFFRIVLSMEHKFVISRLIDLKLGICICCNNAECSVKEL